MRLPYSSLEIDLPEEQVEKIAPHIIPEHHLDVFKFAGENGVCDGMYYLSELYGLVCEFPATGNLQQSQMRIGLGLLSAPVVISVSDERYCVWVQLEVPQIDILFSSDSPACKITINDQEAGSSKASSPIANRQTADLQTADLQTADLQTADRRPSSSHHSKSLSTAGPILASHPSVSNGSGRQAVGQQAGSRKASSRKAGDMQMPTPKDTTNPVVIPPVPMSTTIPMTMPGDTMPPKMPETSLRGLAHNAAVLTKDAPSSTATTVSSATSATSAAPPPEPIIQTFQPTSRTFSASNGIDLSDWVNTSLNAGCRNLLVDLRNVSFMDSSGLGALTTALRVVKQAGGRFALCSLSGQTRMLLEMTNTDQLFEVYINRQGFEDVLKS